MQDSCYKKEQNLDLLQTPAYRKKKISTWESAKEPREKYTEEQCHCCVCVSSKIPQGIYVSVDILQGQEKRVHGSSVFYRQTTQLLHVKQQSFAV